MTGQKLKTEVEMSRNNKIIAWVSIVGAGITASLLAAKEFFPNLTLILTASGGLIGAIVSYVVTKEKKADEK
jgi:hypothetical protein